MAHWPEKLLLGDDFLEQIIQYMGTPIGSSSTPPNTTSRTINSGGIVYISDGMKNTTMYSTKARSSS